MQTKTIVYNTWKYDELSEEQKQKVLNNYYDINVDSDFWYDTGFSEMEIQKYHLKLDESGDLLEYKELWFALDDGYIQFDDCRFAYPETARKSTT